MEQEFLAIASVPVQRWDAGYTPAEALRIGTIFPSLNKPFYAAEEPAAQDACHTKTDGTADQSARQREELLLQVQEISFVVDDARLYLDTHPQDADGLALLTQALGKRKELLSAFAQAFYPLTMDCMAELYQANPGSGCYCWPKGPMPWEGACV